MSQIRFSRTLKKLNGVGKESLAATWINHPFMIEGEKIRQQNIMYLKAFLVVIFALFIPVLTLFL